MEKIQGSSPHSTYPLAAEHSAKLFQTSGSRWANTGHGHVHELPDFFVARAGCLEVQQLQQATAAVRQVLYRFPDILLLLRLDLNLFHIDAGGGGLLKVLFATGLAQSLRPDMNTLARCRCDQPRADLRFVLQFVEMFDELQTDGLEHVRSISRAEIEFDGDRKD